MERLLARKNVAALCRMLSHRDALVRRRAVQALGELGEGTRCIVDRLPVESDGWVKEYAVEALRAIGSPAAIDQLTLLAFSSDRKLAHTAAHILSRMHDSRAQTAFLLYDALRQNAWDAVDALGPEAGSLATVVAQSDAFRGWPSAKRKRLLDFAVRRDAKPTTLGRDNLAEMGVFVGGIHTIADLLKALKHRSPDVQIAAADTLGHAGRRWVIPAVYRRYRARLVDEAHSDVAIALARALIRLGDNRPIRHYLSQINQGDGTAGEALARINLPETVRALFRYAVEQREHRPLLLSALQQCGPEAVEFLADTVDSSSREAKRIFTSLLQFSDHPERVNLLAELARDPDDGVQRAAVQALAAANTADAATKLYLMAEDGPHALLINALSSMSHPAAPDYLKRLIPDLTLLHGIVLDEERQPLEGARLQVIREVHAGQWEGLSTRITVGEDGSFSLAVLDLQEGAHLELIRLPKSFEGTSQTYRVPVALQRGRTHSLEAHIDRFFGTLRVQLIVEPD
ncbi:MAG: HEAT repeat domain-containing protein [Chloroflexi bacterium]|nr:HEAT repeat domain-containing protein [Chloroflexota bacterium]